jgi:hypothetical protein
MSEETETIEELDRSGATALIRWVFEWVFWRVNKDYDPAAGHDQAVVGLLAYKYACDLFNRLAASGRYRLPAGESSDRGLDLLRDGLTGEAFEAMMQLDRAILRRNDFLGSFGWSVGDTRWLLQSMPFGGIDKISWVDKSDTKQLVGRQHYDSTDSKLWDLADYGLTVDESAFADEFRGTTFVLAHGFNGETGAYEVFFGRSRAADQEGEGSWHWRRLIAAGGFGSPRPQGGEEKPVFPGTPPKPNVPDAFVQIRQQADDAATGS